MTEVTAKVPSSIGAAIRSLAAGHHVWSLADQIAVSAASFITLVMVARWGSAKEVGIYAVGGSVLALLLAIQESLITRPYTIQLFQPLGTPAEHAGGSLILSLLMATGVALALAAAGAGFAGFGAPQPFAILSSVLAGVAPLVLLREFVRRFMFAHLRMIQAALLDWGVAALSVLTMLFLGWGGLLSANSAFVAIGAACAIGAAVWLTYTRKSFAYRSSQTAAVMKQSWGLGKWFFLGQLAVQSQSYMTHWLSLLIAGVSVTGVYAACMSIIAFSNPVHFSFINALTPKFVRALRQGGADGLRRQTIQATMLIAGAMALFCFAVFLAGAPVMHLLYPGPEYAGYGHTLSVLALSVFTASVGTPASIALASAERGRVVACVMVTTALLNVVLVWWLMTEWGLAGAAYGILLAEAFGTAMRWLAFLTLMPAIRQNKTEDVARTQQCG
jgi:O-antigen/teichoic acid export membrane protein